MVDANPLMAKTAAKLTIVLWLAVLAFVAPAAIVSGQITNLHEFIGLIWGTLTGLVFAGLLFWLFRKVSHLPRLPLLIGSIGAVVALGITQMAADFAGQYALNYLYSDFRPAALGLKNISLTTLIYICIYGCNMAIFWIIFAAQKARAQEMHLAQVEARAARSELERLRLQLNPHFMCNSLNAVSSLITTGKLSEANHMAERLADFLRASIDVDSTENSLADELDVVGSYLEVEATRVGNRLNVEFACPSHLEAAKVPNFILQPLVENAIKHAVAPSTKQVRIKISAEEKASQLLLSVENDGGAKTPTGSSSTGIGLSNTRARLSMYYGDQGELNTSATPDGYKAVIRMPLRRMEVVAGGLRIDQNSPELTASST